MLIEFFEPMDRIPSTTHNDLVVAYDKHRGRHLIAKSDALKDAEEAWRAHLSRHIPEKPLEGPLAVEMRICYPTRGHHAQGDPKDTPPDADNMEKTIFDVMQGLGFYGNDSQVSLHTTAKIWSDPSGIYVRMEEI